MSLASLGARIDATTVTPGAFLCLNMQGSRPAHLPARSARAFPTTAPPG